MKILITGSTGLIGGRLSKFLSSKNFLITNTSRKKNSWNFKKIIWNSDYNLNRLCKNKNIIINCAGLDVHDSVKKKKTLKVNVDFPVKLYTLANKNNVDLFIFISTYHIYDFNTKNIFENSKIIKKNLYTESKITAENELINYKNKKTKLIIIRTCNLFGFPIYINKNCWRLVINSLVKDFFENGKFTINSNFNSLRYYSSIANFCNFIYTILKKRKKINFKEKVFIINFTSNKSFRIKKLTDLVKKYFSKKIQINKKNKKLKNTNFFNYNSIYLNKIYFRKDLFFEQELKKLISYVTKNFKKK